MSIELKNRLYKIGSKVYYGTTALNVHDQRGRLFIKHNGRQTNIKDVPVLPVEVDPVFDYVFLGGSVTHPCPAMDFWIYRHRMGNKITTNQYKINYNVKTRPPSTRPNPGR